MSELKNKAIHDALYAHLDAAQHPPFKMYDVDCIYDICSRLLAELRDKIDTLKMDNSYETSYTFNSAINEVLGLPEFRFSMKRE